MTKQERKSAAIARSLARALLAIEEFQGDPEMVLNDAQVFIHKGHVGARGALSILRKHYLGEDCD